MVNLVNTGSPFFDGLAFSNGTELLTLIRDNVIWATTSDNIPNDLILTGVTTNGHQCSIQLFNENDKLEVALYKNNIASDRIGLEITQGDTNKLWLLYEQDYLIIGIRNRIRYSGAIYCGFLDRFDTSDPEAYLIAKLDNGINNAIVSEARFNGVDLHRVGDAFADADIFSSPVLNGGYQGVWDLVTLPHAQFSHFNTGRSNAGYFAHEGQINKVNDRPVASKIFYLEGRGAVDNYATSNDNPLPLYNRGFLRGCAKGFGKEPAGKIIEDTKGDRYIVIGGDGEQAILVEQNPVPAIAENQVIVRDSITTVELTGLLSELRNTLTNIGWTVASESSTDIVFRGAHIGTGDFCYFRFTVNNNVLEIQGEAQGISSNVSSSLLLTLNTNNEITQIASSQSAVVNFNNEGGIWFGFLRQEGIDGDPVFGLGLIKDGVQDTYIFVEGTWIDVAAGFAIATDTTSSYPTHNQDSLTTAGTPILFFDNPDSRNSAYKAYNGQVNGYTNQAQLKEYVIIAGATSKIAYGSAASGSGNAPKLNYYGVVDYVCDGMLSLVGGTNVLTSTGARFRSVGGTGWNGMQIA